MNGSNSMGQRMNWVDSMVYGVDRVNSVVDGMDHRVDCMVDGVDHWMDRVCNWVNSWVGQNLSGVRGWGSWVSNSLVFDISDITAIADRVSTVGDHLGPAIWKGHPVGTSSANSI